MVYSQTKNANLGKFWRALDWKMLIYVMAIWNLLQTFVYFMTIWYILCSLGIFFSGFGIMRQEKSGNPDFASLFAREKVDARQFSQPVQFWNILKSQWPVLQKWR
jgi:hypothetical protein